MSARRAIRATIPITISTTLLASLLIAGRLSAAPAAPAAMQRLPATRPAWVATYYRYERPAEMAIELTTPTLDQVRFRGRPKQFEDGDLALAQTPGPVEAAKVGTLNVRRLRFKDIEGDIVPALLCTPADQTGPFPLAIAVHGLYSNKAQVCGQVAPALVKQGFAVLAPDMPAHGERPGNPRELLATKDWVTGITLHRRAVMDILQCIDVAEVLGKDSRLPIDPTHGVVLARYSMGSWLDSVAGSLDPRVRAMVLMVGGATDAAPMLRMLPQLAAADPLVMLPQFAGRPLLMLNARRDRIVTPAMAERLYEAAAEPKQQKWYDSGHILPAIAHEDAAKWIAQTWEQITAAAATTQPALR